MDQCGAGCDLALDLAHVLHEYRCTGNSVYGERDGGDVEHQQRDANDHSDWCGRQCELQPGARAGAGNDFGTERGAGGNGEIYDFLPYAVPGALWDRMLGLHGAGFADAGFGGC